MNQTYLTLRIQQACHSQISLCHIKRLLQVLQVGLMLHSAHVNQSGTGKHTNRRCEIVI